jgi:hypothetical protein
MRLIFFGTSRGSVIVCSLLNLNIIYTRITIHREAITEMQAIFSKTDEKERYLISVCLEKILKVTRLSEGKVGVLKKINLNENFGFI